MKKIISILGSTGSIGTHSLKIFNKNKKLFSFYIFAADKNYSLICKQIIKYKPEIYIINNPDVLKKVRNRFKKNKIKIFDTKYLQKKNIKQSDITIAAIPGIAGLKPTIDLVRKSKKILIANKESIICGWNFIKKAAIQNKTKIVPIDSEHFSIMKLIENHRREEIKKIYLTASGGPFLKFKISKLKNIKPSQAVKHPKWQMGKKISIDSASLMNKMLEFVEAQKIFEINPNKIEIVVHPQSLIHAIVEFKNGLFKFLYHKTTMHIPLVNAIFDKKNDIEKFLKPELNSKRKIFFESLNFLEVNKKRYPIINLKSRINEHISTPIIINAVNEILVDQFLKKKIPFNSFYRYILGVLNDRNYRKYAIKEPKNISQVFQIDQWSRNTVYKKIRK